MADGKSMSSVPQRQTRWNRWAAPRQFLYSRRACRCCSAVYRQLDREASLICFLMRGRNYILETSRRRVRTTRTPSPIPSSESVPGSGNGGAGLRTTGTSKRRYSSPKVLVGELNSLLTIGVTVEGRVNVIAPSCIEKLSVQHMGLAEIVKVDIHSPLRE
jgi:hypothetical protein